MRKDTRMMPSPRRESAEMLLRQRKIDSLEKENARLAQHLTTLAREFARLSAILKENGK
jgi:hypothetical protein